MMTGSSMAAAHTSGLAALLWSVRPWMSADQVAQIMISSADDVYTWGWDERTGAGRINAHTALLYAMWAIHLPVITRTGN